MNESKLHILEPADLNDQQVTVGRYILHRQIARGGMATIHIARLMGAEGFSRIVAAKRLHPEFAEDSEFVAMFLDEARIASKVHHRNVVPVLDVCSSNGEVILVQEYVHGVPLQWLLKTMREAKTQMPINVALSIACQVLAGLHATHEATDELGTPLHIVHRDVSPQNVMVAIDGSSRLLDFGVAKATMAAHVTREGTYKGKLAYSAPEQLRGQATRQSDVYSLSVLLWELLVGQRMHRTARSGAELVATVLNGTLPTIQDALSADGAWETLAPGDRRQLKLLDPIISKGLAVDVRERWGTAAEMEEALVSVVRPAASSVVAAWLKVVGRDFLDGRDRLIAAEEASWRRHQPDTAARAAMPLHSFTNFRMLGHAGKSDSGLILSDTQASHRPKGMIVLVGALSAALLVALALLMQSPGESAPAPEAPAGSAAGVVERVSSVAPVATPVERAVAPAPKPAPVEPAPVEAPAAEPAQVVEEAKSSARHVVDDRPKQARRARVVETRREPEPEPAPAAAPAQPSVSSKPTATDCSTPYYFEGSKKIFKPACL
jgi:serine/threonine protein kinase